MFTGLEGAASKAVVMTRTRHLTLSVVAVPDIPPMEDDIPISLPGIDFHGSRIVTQDFSAC